MRLSHLIFPIFAVFWALPRPGAAETCKDNEYTDEFGECKACAAPCATCDGPSNETNCKSCLTAPKTYFLLGKKCVLNCPIGKFPDNSTATPQCKNCYHGCQICYGGTQNNCSQCMDSHFLLGT